MKSSYLLVGVLLIALCSAAVSAETYYFEGATSNGEYTGTLVVGNDGSAALSLAAVSGGTLSGPAYSKPAPGPTTEPMVSQDLTLNAWNGQGFAGCSVMGASGDSASTGTLVSGTQAAISQEAGLIGTQYLQFGNGISFEGVYASQQVSGGSAGSSLSSSTGAVSASGDTVVVDAVTDGPFSFTQYAMAGSGGYKLQNIDQTLLSGAYAMQSGDFGSDVVEKGFAGAEGTDTTGKNVFVSSLIENGSLYFDQEVAAGIVDSAYGLSPLDGRITGSSAWQNYTLTGTGGVVRSDSINAEGQIYTRNMAEFHNTDNSVGRINGTTEAGSFQVLPLTAGLFGISDTYSGGTSFDIYNLGGTLENSEYRASQVCPVGYTDCWADLSNNKHLFLSMWATEDSEDVRLIVSG
jgi:hypothetical protein